MLKPNPIIEIAVRIHAINVLSPAIIERLRARSVRSSARTVPLSFGAVSTRLMGAILRCAPRGAAKLQLRRQHPNNSRTHTNRLRFSEGGHFVATGPAA